MLTYRGYLEEMAKQLPSPFSMLEFRGDSFKRVSYVNSASYPVVSRSGDLVVQSIHNPSTNSTLYITNNTKLGHTVHVSDIHRKSPTKQLPFDHLEQVSVDRVKSSEHLPKGYVTDFVYNTWDKQSLPLKSSNEQHVQGHAMWKRLSTRALDAGKHVYVSTPESMTKLDASTIDSGISGAFGPDDHMLSKHIILSHTEL